MTVVAITTAVDTPAGCFLVMTDSQRDANVDDEIIMAFRVQDMLGREVFVQPKKDFVLHGQMASVSILPKAFHTYARWLGS